jgi:glycosyltransferase involved in cell wall biosynthesis
MATPLRVLLDGDAMGRGSGYRGMGTYARNLCLGLDADPSLDLTVLSGRGAETPEGTAGRRALRVAPNRWAEREHDLLVPFDIAFSPAQVFMSPGNHPPRRSRIPVVQTLHDVYPLTDPTAPEWERRHWLGRRDRWKRVESIVAVSEFTADAGSEALGIDRSAITVIPHGVDPAFRPADPSDDPGGRSDSPGGPSGPSGGRGDGRAGHLLFVGEYDPRKRHSLAFEVIGHLADRPVVLKVAGQVAPWNAAKISALVAAAPRPDRVELLGYVPLPELVRLYQGARAVLITSSYEGFGFPALEAMACGTPVVAFDNTATAEVVRGAGLLVPDGDVRAMTEAVRTILDDDETRSRLCRSGLERAAEYTWARSVARHGDVLRRTAGRS